MEMPLPPWRRFAIKGIALRREGPIRILEKEPVERVERKSSVPQNGGVDRGRFYMRGSRLWGPIDEKATRPSRVKSAKFGRRAIGRFWQVHLHRVHSPALSRGVFVRNPCRQRERAVTGA